MEGKGENKWKFIKTAILKRFWQNNTEKTAYENIFIPEAVGSYSQVFTVFGGGFFCIYLLLTFASDCI